MQTRFTILGMMEFTTGVGLLIGADRLAFQVSPSSLTFVGAIETINAITGAYLGVRLRRTDTLEATIRSVRLTSVCVSLLNSLVIAAIVADRLRVSTNGEYFSWSRDWIQFAIAVAAVSIVSVAGGMFLSILYVGLVKLRDWTANGR